jgi:hypothetical protein
MKAKAPIRITVMKPTLDDWYPCHVLFNDPSGLTTGVKVSFIELSPYNNQPRQWRVCVWGNDDCGMKIDFDDDKQIEAKALFDTIISWDSVDKDELKKNGFGF